MPIDGAPTGRGSDLSVIVGRVDRPGTKEPERLVDEHGRRLPVLKDPWRDRAIVRYGTVVRKVEGTLPDWAEPAEDGQAASILDIVVLTDGPSFAAHEDWRVGSTACHFRIVISDAQTLACDTVWHRLPRADISISAVAADFDTVARCFVDVMSGGGLVGIDARDVLDLVGCRGSRVARGRATVIPGRGVAAGRAARDTIAMMEDEGEGNDVILYQSISAADSTSQDLFELDAMATAATSGRDRPFVLAGVLDRPRTEVVVVAFEK